MPINAEYRGPGELPEVIPVFPLPGALLLPRGQMPLNIFSRAISRWSTIPCATATG